MKSEAHTHTGQGCAKGFLALGARERAREQARYAGGVQKSTALLTCAQANKAQSPSHASKAVTSHSVPLNNTDCVAQYQRAPHTHIARVRTRSALVREMSCPQEVNNSMGDQSELGNDGHTRACLKAQARRAAGGALHDREASSTRLRR